MNTAATDEGTRTLLARSRVRRLIPLLGPALVAGVAYLDPGNVASNMAAGAKYGYLLVWVVVAANLMAWLVQYLSAKLGLVTGRSLPELMGQRLTRRWQRWLYWLQAEIVAMATDLAEVIGGAVALNLLFNVPLLTGGVITGVVSMIVLGIHTRRDTRPFERVIIAMMAVIVVGFSSGIILRPPDAGAALAGLTPQFQGSGSVLLAVSILGATIMPHAIYAHSALTRDRFGRVAPGESRRLILRATRADVTVALGIAGAVNVIILLLAATSLHGASGTETLQGAYDALASTLGPAVAILFAVGLLASGLASTSVGAYAGAEIMQGLLRLQIPLLVRRGVTLVPALIILGTGYDPTTALVLSQVFLSFGIPFALIPLVILTAQKKVLGISANRWFTTLAATATVVVLVALNVTLVVLLLG